MNEEKKDLTSLLDLAKREPPSLEEGGAPIAMDMPVQENISEDDFGSLEDAAKKAIAEGHSFAAEAPVAQELQVPAPVDAQEIPDFQMPTYEEQSPEVSPQVAEPVEVVEVAEGLPEPAPDVVVEEPPQESVAVNAPHNILDHDATEMSPPPQLATHSHQMKEAPVEKQDMASLKQYGEKFAIGHPRIEASPPFSILATLTFDAKKESQINDILSAQDFGVRMADVSVQLKSGRLLIPKISEFAAVTLAQRLIEVVDTIEVGLSDEIFKSKNRHETDSDFENIFFDAEAFHSHSEEARDLGAEPESERDLFTTHLTTFDGFRVTRLLSAISASKVVPSNVVDDIKRGRLELESDALTKELVTKAFKLGAHGIIGILFTLKATEMMTPEGKQKIYRLWAMGTAVRMQALPSKAGNQDVP